MPFYCLLCLNKIKSCTATDNLIIFIIGRTLPTGVQGSNVSQVAFEKQIATPPPSYPSWHSIIAVPLKTVVLSAVIFPFGVEGRPQSAK